MNFICDRKKLENEPESYWLNLLKKYFIDKPMVVVKGIPSIEKQRTSTREEETRIAKQMEKHGAKGLTQRDVELKQAIKENEVTHLDTTREMRPKSFARNENLSKTTFFMFINHNQACC